MSVIEILDCTLRDGSYLINFQFNTNDTFHISKLLEDSGIKYIEVGHGLGLDAGKNKNFSLETDIDYVKAAKEATSTSKIGVFYIPGIGNMKSINEAVKAGLDFIRVGVNVNEFTEAKESLEYAKSLGLEVWLNLMKTYTVTTQEWRDICEQLKDYKCDHLAIVDSAGGMLPSQVKEYCQIAKEVTGLNIGFHGHNNLQLAVANCLAAIDGGASIVDGTLFGMGRSGGNASTEILAAIFKREGLNTPNYNAEMLIDIANKYIAPLARRNLGDSAVEVAAGVNLFHSSFFKTVKTSCDRANVSIFKTILNLPPESRVFVTSEMVEETVSRLKSGSEEITLNSLSRSNTIFLNSLEEFSKYLKEISGKTNLKVVLSLSQSNSTLTNPRISNVYSLEESLIGHMEFSDFNQLSLVVEKLKGLVNIWSLDVNCNTPHSNIFNGLELFYHDEKEIEKNVLNNEVLNSGRLPFEVLSTSSGLAIQECSSFAKPCNSLGRIIVVNKEVQDLSEEVLSQLNSDDVVVFTHRCNINDSHWKILDSKDIMLYRLNYTLALAYELEKNIKYKVSIQNSRGKLKSNGLELVSGGVLGVKGSIIVDDYKEPSVVLGVSDGKGGVVEIVDEVSTLNQIRASFFPDLK